MASIRSQLQEETRFRILRLLEENPELSQRELARQAGISVGAAHYLLTALVEKGLVKIGNFTSAPDKRRYAYILTPKGLREKTRLTGQFLKRKLVEYEELKAEIEKLRQEAAADAPQAKANKQDA